MKTARLEDEEVPIEYRVPKPEHNGEKILRNHMLLTSKHTATVKVDGATPFARRVLDFNNGSCPESIFRVYCMKCKKMRTLVIYPAMSKVEFKASCPHILANAVALATKDSTLVYIGKYRIVPVGVVDMLKVRVLG